MRIRWPDMQLPPINQRVLVDALTFQMMTTGNDMSTADGSWVNEQRIERIGQNGNEGLHYPQVETEPLSAPWFLEQGLKHMQERAVAYDKASMGGERSMGACVNAFIAITGDGKMDTAERGWLFMVLLKLTRSQQGQFRSDNYEDATAYCGLMGESAVEERQ